MANLHVRTITNILSSAHYVCCVQAGCMQMMERNRKQLLSLTHSQLAKTKDTIELLSSLASPSTSQNSGTCVRGSESSRFLSGASDAGCSQSDVSRKRGDKGES